MLPPYSEECPHFSRTVRRLYLAPVVQFRGSCCSERLGCFCPHAASSLTLAGGSVMPCYCATHLGEGDHALVQQLDTRTILRVEIPPLLRRAVHHKLNVQVLV